MDKPPNILFAFANDRGRYAGAYRGVPGASPLNELISTPAMRIAREGSAQCGDLMKHEQEPKQACVGQPQPQTQMTNSMTKNSTASCGQRSTQYERTKESAGGRQPCLVIRLNHFDPIWQRCWDRPILDQGRLVVPYRKIEDACIEDGIESCADGRSSFMVEASWVLRHYLERHPEHVPVLRRLTAEGRFELLGSGENIVDTNIIDGELLCRNLVLGTLWGEQALGRRPDSGWVQDTFGTSAQLPQIYRSCGYRWLAWIIYVYPDRPYWRGLDGSVVFTHREDKDSLATYMCSKGGNKQVPCPDCQGHGCAACRGRGFRTEIRLEFDKPPEQPKPFKAGAMWLYGEESLPGLQVEEDIARFMKSQSLFDVRQGTFRELGTFVADEIAAADDPPEDRVSTRVENNPVFTGYYVTRIRAKQIHRSAEQALLRAEVWDSVLHQGRSAEELRELWRLMSLAGFHDAVTGTLCDEAFDELMELLAEVLSRSSAITARACAPLLKDGEGMFTVFNAGCRQATAPVKVVVPERWEGASVELAETSLPVYGVRPDGDRTEITFLAENVPAFGAVTVQIAPKPASVDTPRSTELRRGQFSVTAGEHGITDLRVEGIGPILDPAKYMLGELILEADHGGPWGTFSPDRSRVRLAEFSKLEAVRSTADCIEITYAGTYPGGEDHYNRLLGWRQCFRLCRGLPWLEVETVVEWFTVGKRLRLAFPTTADHDRGVYSIPYGVLERDRYELPNDGYEACGDWPALHWAGIQTPGHVLAVFNQGTPSHRVENGTLLISVLRSPRWTNAVRHTAAPLRNDSFETRHYHGRLDHGTHRFRHAVYAVPGDWRDSEVSWQARLFNAGLEVFPGELAGSLPDWSIESSHTAITAVKKAEDGVGIIVRLVEMSGRPEAVRLRVPPVFTSAWQCNLLEGKLRPIELRDRAAALEIGAWKIETIRFA